MTLQIQNLDKIIGHTHRWYHWKIVVRDWEERPDEYLFHCVVCDLKNMTDTDWLIRVCRGSLIMKGHKADHSWRSLTPDIQLETKRIRDLDLFVKEMAHTINSVI